MDISNQKIFLTNEQIDLLITDKYMLTMIYKFFKVGIHNKNCAFEFFYRTNPFKGNVCIFGGLEESIKVIERFKIDQNLATFITATLNVDQLHFFKLSIIVFDLRRLFKFLMIL